MKRIPVNTRSVGRVLMRVSVCGFAVATLMSLWWMVGSVKQGEPDAAEAFLWLAVISGALTFMGFKGTPGR